MKRKRVNIGSRIHHAAQSGVPALHDKTDVDVRLFVGAVELRDEIFEELGVKRAGWILFRFVVYLIGRYNVHHRVAVVLIPGYYPAAVFAHDANVHALLFRMPENLMDCRNHADTLIDGKDLFALLIQHDKKAPILLARRAYGFHHFGTEHGELMWASGKHYRVRQHYNRHGFFLIFGIAGIIRHIVPSPELLLYDNPLYYI